jgi:hypothetical protein
MFAHFGGVVTLAKRNTRIPFAPACELIVIEFDA